MNRNGAALLASLGLLCASEPARGEAKDPTGHANFVRVAASERYEATRVRRSAGNRQAVFRQRGGQDA